MRSLHGWVGAGWLIAVAACSASPAQTPAPGPGPLPGGSTSELVSPEGATVTTPDGVTIVVPAGAVSTATFLTVTAGVIGPYERTTGSVYVDGGALLTITAVGPTYSFNVGGAPDLDTAMLAAPVTVTLPFDPGKVPTGRASSDVAVYTSTNAWRAPLPTTSTDATHVSAQTSQLGAFTPAVGMLQPCICTAGKSCGNSVCDGG